MKWNVGILGQGLAQITSEARRTGKLTLNCSGVASRQWAAIPPSSFAAMDGPGDNRIPAENMILRVCTWQCCWRHLDVFISWLGANGMQAPRLFPLEDISSYDDAADHRPAQHMMHCFREEHECVPSGLTWILSGSFVAPRSCAGSQPATWRAQQQGEQDPWHEAKTSVCASPAIASQRTQYAILVASDHRVRVLHDFGVGRVTRCLDNV
jgi:hypothetical protein